MPAPHQVDIPLGNGILHAQLYKPDGDGPFPVVIALHGCGGLAGRSEPVQPRYRDWAEQLLKDGKAVLLPDSYGSRELGPQCRVKERRVPPAASGWPTSWRRGNGWCSSPGPRTIASACWAGRTAPARCCGRCVRNCRRAAPSRISARRSRSIRTAGVSSGLGWSARVPTLVLIGAKDDVSSPPACRQMIDGARGRSALTRIVVYPSAYHDFDRANLPLHAIVATSDATAARTAAISAPMPKRAPIRKSASPNGWRGERSRS